MSRYFEQGLMFRRLKVEISTVVLQTRQHQHGRVQFLPDCRYLFPVAPQRIFQCLLGSICLGCLSTITGCSGAKSTQTAPAATPPSVVVTAIEPQTVPIYSEYVGTAQAVNTVEIHSQVQGFLQQIAFRDGSAVTKGQALFTIDPRTYQAALTEANASLKVQQATLNNAQKIVDRYTPLTQQHALAQQTLDSAVATTQENQAQVLSAQAQVATAQLNVNFTQIKAPMAGNIGVAQVKVGDLVQSGSTLLATIYSVSPIYVTFAISQSDYLAYAERRKKQPKVAHPIRLILGNGTTYNQTGTMDMSAPTVSTSTGTLLIRASFPNPDGLLKPGMFTRVRFVAREATNALLVPQSSIQQLQGTQSIFVLGTDGKVQQRTITTGATVQNCEIVNSGLQVGDKIIVQGTQKVQPGISVNAQVVPQQQLSTATISSTNTQTSTAPSPATASSSGSSTASKSKEQ
jgi:membrane fusion protein (multidrug efflux system)